MKISLFFLCKQINMKEIGITGSVVGSQIFRTLKNSSQRFTQGFRSYKKADWRK
jgi:hypothetical protein